MTNDPNSRTQELGTQFPADAFLWILRQRVSLPQRVAGYVHRPELVNRAMPTQRRLTVLKAGGGFGKTVLLAECCRQLRANGVAAAWLSLDGSDASATLDPYIPAPCASAGLVVRDRPDAGLVAQPAASRVAMVAQELQAMGRPFVIALDDLEELTDSASVALIAFLLRQGPPNLHLAIAGRRLPDGLDVAGPALDGQAEILGSEDLRFARSEVSAFFHNGLSRRALAREASRSAGWPFALRVSRNSGNLESGSAGGEDGLSANWIESRLFAGLAADARDAVLDLGQFQWADDALLEEALPSIDALRRVRSLGALDGLLEPVRSGATRSWRLHPLLRAHCAAQRFREDPERARSIHRRIARALALRGDTVAGMRHAVQGADARLAGEIFVGTGGVRLWLRHGVTPFHEANGLLPEAVVAASPRLGLARCIHLTLTGRHHDASALYARCAPAAKRVGGEEGGTHGDVHIDDCIVRGTMGLYRGEPVDSPWMRAVVHDAVELCQRRGLDAPTRGHFEYRLSVLHFIKGEFDQALERLTTARELLRTSKYIEFYGGLLHAQIHFLRGAVPDAERHFRKARQVVRTHLLLDPVAMMSCEVARRELLLERDPSAATEPGGIRKALTDRGLSFSSFATSLSLFTQAKLVSGGADEVAAFAEKALVRVRAVGMPAYARLLAAAQVTALVAAGRIEEAERAWQRAALPSTAASCVDTERLSWREVESLSEARSRLLIATAGYDEARDLLRAYHAAAEGRGFRRTQLRAVALRVRLEQQAGDSEASLRQVRRYLGLFAESPLMLPMVLEREACEAPLRRFLRHAEPGSAEHGNVKLLLAAMRRAEDCSGLSLSDREREVLRLLPGNPPVKSMARLLGLSVHGVRYHLRKLFAKLNATSRPELLRRAEELGLTGSGS
ncbi:MAG: hypothetical protein F4Y57_03700 [Acidobacteria bacterium]|nr:hypothetical protein [Acidobacteriota bacterium]